MIAPPCAARPVTYLEALVAVQEGPGRIISLTWATKYDSTPMVWHAECFLGTDLNDVRDKLQSPGGQLMVYDNCEAMTLRNVALGYCKSCACGINLPRLTFFKPTTSGAP